MGKRTIETDMIAMALLYRLEYTGSNIISYEKAKEFDRIINENLDKRNSECGVGIMRECQNKLYFLAHDENGKYAVIRPDADIKEAWNYHVNVLPTDMIFCSLQNNALNSIDLQQDSKGNIIHKNDTKDSERLEEIINKVVDKPAEFYEKIEEALTPEERNKFRELIKNKSCFSCTNGSCRVEYQEKEAETKCFGWNNREQIGKQFLLRK